MATAKTWADTPGKVGLLVGGLLTLLLAGVAALLVGERWMHVRSWPTETAEVLWAGTLCRMEVKSVKNWREIDVVDCAEADAFRDRNRAAYPTMRASRLDYVTLSYSSAGGRSVLSLRFPVSGEPVAAGARIDVLVDPADPFHLDRQFAPADIRNAAALLAAGPLVGLLIFALGSATLAWRRRRSAARPE